MNDESGALGVVLARAATCGGAVALGGQGSRLQSGEPFDAVVVDLDHPFFDHVPPQHALDALFTAGTSAPIRQVVIHGREML